MPKPFSLLSPMFRLLICLLVVGTHTHCVLAHGAELVREVQAAKCAESPIGEAPSCGNESACICKGATLGAKLDVTLASDDLTTWLASLESEASYFITSLPCQDIDSISEPAPPAHGTGARALLQSFQI